MLLAFQKSRVFRFTVYINCINTKTFVGDFMKYEFFFYFLFMHFAVFQYSSYHSVSEVTKPNYEGCNTTNILQTSSNGNTTYALNNPGDRYFVCGNRLHCLGGMKLHVNVQDDRAASPAYAPETVTGGSLPPGSTKSNNSPLPSSAFLNYVGLDYVFVACLGLSSVLFGMI